jgi:GAF domain-containing protein
MSTFNLQQVFKWGADAVRAPYLKNKITLSNQMALLIIVLVAMPFSFISYFFFRPLTPVAVLGLFICSSVVLLNRQGMVYLSRVILAVIPITLTAIYNAALSDAGEDPVLGTYLIELSFMFIPFYIFDVREQKYLLPVLLLNISIFLTYPLSNRWLELEWDTSILEYGLLDQMFILLGTFSCLAGIFVLVRQNYRSEQVSAELLARAEDNHRKAVEQENKLKHTLETVKKSQLEEKRRQWAAEGLAQCTRILRSHDNAGETYDELISFIVRYIKANQGGLFITEGEGEDILLKMASCYAYDRKKFLNKELAPGQGLLGQVYLEQEEMYLKELPKDYVNITSGLGGATPTNLLLVPLQSNEVVEGVLELASFEEMEKYEREFIVNLGETIASHIRNLRVSEQTRELLEESRQQTEMMRAQEEEMRQNMEELQATQEEMTRKQQEVEKLKEQMEERLQQESEASQQEISSLRQKLEEKDELITEFQRRRNA